MDSIIERCCGIDVHRAELTACVRMQDNKGKVTEEIQRFGTTTPDLLALRDWLAALAVTHVAMESTGVYWKPVYYVLEDEFEVLLVNANHIKHVPGRKTDTIDAAWIAQLLAHGLLKGSFIPPKPIRRLRDLTRYRKALIQERTREVNRVHKILEDAGVKLATVATDVMGLSGRNMMRALISGESDPDVLAELARGRLRAKLPALRKALTSRFQEHHAFLLERMLSRVEELESDIEVLSARIEGELVPFEDLIELLDTIPGVNRRGAEVILAEVGNDMSRFPTPKHLASWAGICPGQNESAGKRKSEKTRKGSKWLRTTLIECASAAARSKHTYLGARYRQIAKRRGHKKAVVATAHTIITVVWQMLSKTEPYVEAGADIAISEVEEQKKRRAIRELQRLGYGVELNPLPKPA